MRKLTCILLLLAALLSTSLAPARRAKVKGKNVVLKEQRRDSITEAEVVCDSISFSGYDKPAQSDREVFFVSNNQLASTLRRMELRIAYYTTDGRQLHERTVKIDCNIPPGETRMVDIRSWDKQNSFRYHLSREGRNPATPYDVHISLLKAWVSKR